MEALEKTEKSTTERVNKALEAARVNVLRFFSWINKSSFGVAVLVDKTARKINKLIYINERLLKPQFLL